MRQYYVRSLVHLGFSYFMDFYHLERPDVLVNVQVVFFDYFFGNRPRSHRSGNLTTVRNAELGINEWGDKTFQLMFERNRRKHKVLISFKSTALHAMAMEIHDNR